MPFVTTTKLIRTAYRHQYYQARLNHSNLAPCNGTFDEHRLKRQRTRTQIILATTCQPQDSIKYLQQQRYQIGPRESTPALQTASSAAAATSPQQWLPISLNHDLAEHLSAPTDQSRVGLIESHTAAVAAAEPKYPSRQLGSPAGSPTTITSDPAGNNTSNSVTSSASNFQTVLITFPIMATTTAPAAPAAAAAVGGGGLLGSPSAAAAVHSILGTSIPLNQITQVKMVMDSKCKMGISFWPMFSFKPPERDEKAGTAKLVSTADVPPEMTAASSSSSSSGGSSEVPSVSSQLLHVNFTQDPPDEFSVGAKFLGGIPFPFITIRTTRLEGTIDPNTGAVVLLFEAKFLAGFGKKEPTALTVNAHLTTEPATAFKRRMEGKRLENGRTTLVSAAEVPKTSSWFANIILWLPTAATAKLAMKLEFS